MSRTTSNLLPQVSFSILLALSLKPRHGYELIRQINEDSKGVVKLGPGALYGSIQRLTKESLIEEMPFEDDSRRKYYRLTKKGWDKLGAEIIYLDGTLRLAQDRKILTNDFRISV